MILAHILVGAMYGVGLAAAGIVVVLALLLALDSIMRMRGTSIRNPLAVIVPTVLLAGALIGSVLGLH